MVDIPAYHGDTGQESESGHSAEQHIGERRAVREANALYSSPDNPSTMVFDRVAHNNRSLVLDPPLVLIPELDESGQLYVAVDDGLGVHVFAPTRRQLAREVAEQLLFLWDTYVQEDPERMTKAAQQLRQALLNRIKEAA